MFSFDVLLLGKSMLGSCSLKKLPGRGIFSCFRHQAMMWGWACTVVEPIFPRVTEKDGDEPVPLLGVWSTQTHFFIRGIWNSASLRKSKRSHCWPAVSFLQYFRYWTMPYAKCRDQSYGLDTTVFITVGRLLVLMMITVSPCELLLFQICPLGPWGQRSFSSALLLETKAPLWH